MAVDVGSAVGYLDLDISGFLKGLRTAQEESEKTTKSIGQQLGSGLEGIGSKLQSAGSTLTKSVTTPVLGLGATVIKTSADFESAMSKVQAISGASGDDLQALQDKARQMGADTKFSATEAAEALQYMAMAGWDVDSMMGGISGVMNLAAASGEDLASVSDIVTDAMTAFGLSADGVSTVLKDGVEKEVDNTTRFVDALAAASNSSNTNVAMLGESFKYVAPVAGALGYSVEDTSVALGLMANQGIKASQSGNALRTILTNMANPTETMAAAMDQLGVSLTDGDGEMLSLMQVMQDLRSGFAGGKLDTEEFTKSISDLDQSFFDGKITEEEYNDSLQKLFTSMYGLEGAQKAQAAAQLAGKTGLSALLAIVNTGEEDFNNLSDAIYNANGTSQEMADIMIDNLSGQMTILMSKLQELALQFGEILLPVIKDVVSWLQGLIDKLQSLSPEQKEQIVRWAAIAAAVGPVLLVIGKVITTIGTLVTAFSSIGKAISSVKSAFTLLSTALGTISAPIVAIVAVIGTLVAAFVNLWNTNEEFRNSITAIWDSIKSSFETFVQGISERLSALGVSFTDITNAISVVWNGFCNLLAPVFEAAFSSIGVILDTVFGVITGILDVFIGLFTGNWEQAWEGVKEVFGSVWDGIKGLFNVAVDFIKSVAGNFSDWFSGLWKGLWDGVKSLFTSIWTGIKTFFSTTLNAIKSVVSTVWNAIKTTIENILNAIKTVITNVWNTIKTTISTVINGIKSTLETVWNAIKTTISNVVNGIKTTVSNTFENMRSAVVNTVNNVKTSVTNTFNNIKSSLTSIAENIKTSVSNTFDKLKSAMSDAVDKAKELVTDSMQKAKDGVVKVWDGITDTFKGIGGDIIQGIIDGIGGMVGKLYESIKSALSGLVEKAKDALDINSPSGVMRDEIGKQMPPGIAIGFESAMSKATKDIQKSIDKNIDSLSTEDITIGVNTDMEDSISSVADYYKSIEVTLAESVRSMKNDLEYLVSVGSHIGDNVQLGYIGYNGVTNGKTTTANQPIDQGDNTRGGNIYVFYSPKAIDEIEAARQIRRTERDMAEGFS